MSVAHPCEGSAPLDVQAPLPRDVQSIVARLWPGIGADPAAWPERTLVQLARPWEEGSGGPDGEEG
jgi:hypothetical protein